MFRVCHRADCNRIYLKFIVKKKRNDASHSDKHKLIADILYLFCAIILLCYRSTTDNVMLSRAFERCNADNGFHVIKTLDAHFLYNKVTSLTNGITLHNT